MGDAGPAVGKGAVRIPEGLSERQLQVILRFRKFCPDPQQRPCKEVPPEVRDECVFRKKDGTVWTFESQEHARTVMIRLPVRQATTRVRPHAGEGVNAPGVWAVLPEDNSNPSGDDAPPTPPAAIEDAQAVARTMASFSAAGKLTDMLEQALEELNGLDVGTPFQAAAKKIGCGILEMAIAEPNFDFATARAEATDDLIGKVDPEAAGADAKSRKKKSRLKTRAREMIAESGLGETAAELLLPREDRMGRPGRAEH